jgi:hypothetical protein
MNINLKNGIDQLLFGMKQKDVVAIYGKPNREFKDEDDNLILIYNALKLRLTFYQDENYRLGYIIASSPKLVLFGNEIIGKKINEVKQDLASNAIVKFTQEDFDTLENFFNEDHWLLLQVEFGEVIKVEIGAIINVNDEFDWKFILK